MKFITFTTVIFGVIALSGPSIVPSDKDIYMLDKPISNNIYISLLPETKREDKQMVDSSKHEKLMEIVKNMCSQGVNIKGDKDIYTCAIKTVTVFIACMHVDKDGLKETTEADPLLKCLSQAVSVFVKCIMSTPSSVLDKYSPDVVMHME